MSHRSPFRPRAAALLAASILLVGVPGCGGKSNPTNTEPVARFTPDVAAPPAGSIAMLEGSHAGPHDQIRVTVTGVNGFFGAAFRVTYDPTALVYEGLDDSTSLLRQGGATVVILAQTGNTGELVVTATRLDPTAAGPVDVTDTSDLVILKFGALQALSAASGLGRLDFGDPKQACDGTLAPPGCGSIPVTWSGGLVTTSR